MSKGLLKIENPVDYDFLVAGIICGFKNYRICFALNEKFKFDLIRVDDFSISAGIPGSYTVHAKYNGVIEGFNPCTLVSNCDINNTGYFIPELKNIDFFLIFEDKSKKEKFNDCIQNLRTIKIVTGAYEIDPKKVKSADAFFILLDS